MGHLAASPDFVEDYSRFPSVLQATRTVPCQCSSVSLSLTDPTMEWRREGGVMRPCGRPAYRAASSHWRRQQDMSPASGQSAAKPVAFPTSHVTWIDLNFMEASRRGCNSPRLIGPAAAPRSSLRMGGRH